MNVFDLATDDTAKSVDHFRLCLLFIGQIDGCAQECHVLDYVGGIKLPQRLQTALHHLTAEAESNE